MLPDVLDMPAALGSETALSILTQQGDTAYAHYPEQMQMLRSAVHSAPEELWSASLYAGWLYTLNPPSGGKGCRLSVVHDDGAVEKEGTGKPTRAALPSSSTTPCSMPSR